MTETPAAPETLVCDACGREQPSGKLSGGWKRHADRIWCRACWKRTHVVRPIHMSVVEPVEGGTKDEWWAALRQAWRDATALSNWAAMQLYAEDLAAAGNRENLGAMPPVYLYGRANETGLALGDSNGRGCIFQAVQKAYRSRRKEVIFSQTARPPLYVYPTPWRCKNVTWKALRDGDGGHPLVSLRLGDRRWTLRLFAGARHRDRVMRKFDQLVRGDVLQGELMLVPQTADAAAKGAAGDGTRRGSKRVIGCALKMIAHWPIAEREPRRATSGVLRVRTDPSCLLVYHVDGDTGDDALRRLHADDLRGIVLSHAQRLDRLSDDRKHEDRVPAHRRRKLAEQREPEHERYNLRVRACVQRAAAAIAGYAARRGCGLVVYDDCDRSYMVSGPWNRLETAIRSACEPRGIAMEAAGTVPAAEVDSDE